VQQLLDTCEKTLKDLETLLKTQDTAAQGNRKWTSTLSWPLKQKDARALLDDVMRHKTSISLLLLRASRSDLHDVANDIADLSGILTSFHNMLRSQSDADLLRWICPLNVMYRDAHEAALGKRFGTTGAWLLRSAEYTRWVSVSDSGGQPFCLHGMSGAGKSVLCSVVVQDLLQRAAAEDDEQVKFVVCYFHFSMKDATRNYLAAMYDTLVRQLLQSCRVGFADVADLAVRLNFGHPPRNDYASLCKRLLSRRRVFLAVDGVDSLECREVEKLEAFLDELLSSCLNLKLFFTTRVPSQLGRLHRQNGYDV